jgi:thioredoxin 1
MTLEHLWIVLVGLAAGVVFGLVIARRPVHGGIAGAVMALVVAFGFVRGPSRVKGVESEDAFQEMVLDAARPVLVQFYSDKCLPCKRFAVTVDKLADDYKDKIDVVGVDVLALPAIAARYEVRAIPYVILFADGQPARGLLGNLPTAVYREAIESVLP